MKNEVRKKNRMAVNSTAPQMEYKQFSKKTSKGKIAKTIMIIALLVIAVVLVLTSGAFSISEIIVEGNSIISDEQVISFSGIEKGTNLFAISKKEITANLKENSYVEDVQVQRCLPNTVKLIIDEREIGYALQLASSYVYIDEQGYILKISNDVPDVPIILGFTTDLSNIKENSQLEENDLNKMSVVKKIMETAANHELESLITRIDISNEENYAIYFDTEGKIAYLGNGTELNSRFLYIKAILAEQQGKTGRIYVNVDLNSEYVYFSEEVI